MLHTLNCPSCKRKFQTNFKKKYCTKECANYERIKNHGEVVKRKRKEFYQANPLVCLACKKSFIRTHGTQRYCEDSCRLKAQAFKFNIAKKLRRKMAKDVLVNKRATIDDMKVLGKWNASPMFHLQTKRNWHGSYMNKQRTQSLWTILGFQGPCLELIALI